jgi:hypothetical protein
MVKCVPLGDGVGSTCAAPGLEPVEWTAAGAPWHAVKAVPAPRTKARIKVDRFRRRLDVLLTSWPSEGDENALRWGLPLGHSNTLGWFAVTSFARSLLLRPAVDLILFAELGDGQDIEVMFDLFRGPHVRDARRPRTSAHARTRREIRSRTMTR